MSETIIKKGQSLDEIIKTLSYELADPTSVYPYDQDRQVTLSYGSLYNILTAIQEELKKEENNSDPKGSSEAEGE